MSTILKALKKLEERKAAAGQRKGDIAWDILREERRGRTLELRPLYLVGLLFSVVVLLALVWYLLPPREQRPAAALPGPESVRDERRVNYPVGPPPQSPSALSSPSRAVDSPPASVAAAAPGSTSIPTGLHLTVSGIAFQDNVDARLAIVNDLPVMVGTMIDGVVVEKIEIDHVVFSRRDDRFSIYLPGHHE